MRWRDWAHKGVIWRGCPACERDLGVILDGARSGIIILEGRLGDVIQLDMKREVLSLALIGWLALAPAAVAQEVGIAGDMVATSDNTVSNGQIPTEGRQVWQLQELWRIGGEDDEENFFGVIGQAFTDDRGQIYLVDFQLDEVQVFSADGGYLRTLGRQGEGPGEVRGIRGALLMPTGTLAMVQGFPGKLVQVDLDGTPAGSVLPGRSDPTAGGMIRLTGAACHDGLLVISGTRIDRGERTVTRHNFISSFTTDGAAQVSFLEAPYAIDRAHREVVEVHEYFPHTRWAIGPDSRVYVAPERNRYLIEVYKPDGERERSFERSYESYRRTAAERERIEADLQPRRRRRNPQPVPVTVEDTDPDIIRLRVAADGGVWVLSSRGGRNQESGILATYDIFAPDGRFIRQVAMACEGHGQRDALIFLSDNRLLLIKDQVEATRAFRGGPPSGEAAAEEDASVALEIVCYGMAAQ